MKRLNTIINKIRRLAVKHHKPMSDDYLNTITAKIKNYDEIDLEKLGTELNKVNIFRKIRLAYALKFRTQNADSILYKIRNGKGFATNFEFTNQNGAQNILDIVLESVIKDVGENVKGKKIFIPTDIIYALPATEKQFTGMFPSGTCVTIPKDMVFGVHWDNVGDYRIDLDLSLLSVNEKYGWDGLYRDEDTAILFSGDVTNASKPNGASELFYIKKQTDNALLMLVNYYNHDEEVEVPFKIFTAFEAITYMKTNYMVNPNNIVATTQSKINQQQKILGIVVTTKEECRFYFSETNIGTSITSSNNDTAENARKYLLAFYTNTISLNEVLKQAGAEFVTARDLADIDLSPTSLNKNSIIDLLI